MGVSCEFYLHLIYDTCANLMIWQVNCAEKVSESFIRMKPADTVTNTKADIAGFCNCAVKLATKANHS